MTFNLKTKEGKIRHAGYVSMKKIYLHIMTIFSFLFNVLPDRNCSFHLAKIQAQPHN